MKTETTKTDIKKNAVKSSVNLRNSQRVITTELKRTGSILFVPSDCNIDNNNPVLVIFDEGGKGWIRPSHLENYSDN